MTTLERGIQQFFWGSDNDRTGGKIRYGTADVYTRERATQWYKIQTTTPTETTTICCNIAAISIATDCSDLHIIIIIIMFYVLAITKLYNIMLQVFYLVSNVQIVTKGKLTICFGDGLVLHSWSWLLVFDREVSDV